MSGGRRSFRKQKSYNQSLKFLSLESDVKKYLTVRGPQQSGSIRSIFSRQSSNLSDALKLHRESSEKGLEEAQTPSLEQVMLDKRSKVRAKTRKKNLMQLLGEISTDKKAQIADELQRVTQEYVLEITKINPTDNFAYHNPGHFAEMAAAVRLQLRNAGFREDNPDHKVYIELAVALHAAHDVVQHMAKDNKNEIASIVIFLNDLQKAFGDDERLRPLLEKFEEMAIDTIYFGTKPNKKYSRPIGVDMLISGKLRVDDFDPYSLNLMLCAAGNDTQQMNLVKTMMQDEDYKDCFKKQMQACSNNMLVDAVWKRGESKDEDLLIFLHHFGANFRMGVCELGYDRLSSEHQTIVDAFTSYMQHGSDRDVPNGLRLIGNAAMDALLKRDDQVDLMYKFIMDKFFGKDEAVHFAEITFAKNLSEVYTTEELQELAAINRSILAGMQKHDYRLTTVQHAVPSNEASGVNAWEIYHTQLGILKSKIVSMAGSDIDKKREFIIDALKIARNQQGLYLSADMHRVDLQHTTRRSKL